MENLMLFSVCVDIYNFLSRDQLPITSFSFSVEFSQERKDGTEEMEMFGKNPEITKFSLNSV